MNRPRVAPSKRLAGAAVCALLCSTIATTFDQAPPSFSHATQTKPVSRSAGEIVLEPASLSTPETGKVDFELGTLYVPENRAEPSSRLIGVGFARFREFRQLSEERPRSGRPADVGDEFRSEIVSRDAKR